MIVESFTINRELAHDFWRSLSQAPTTFGKSARNHAQAPTTFGKSGEFKNKIIILDNASSHRNSKVKEIINQHNHLLYTVPYQHFTNSIENYCSMLKSRLQKLDGLTHVELKRNITKNNLIRTSCLILINRIL